MDTSNENLATHQLKTLGVKGIMKHIWQQDSQALLQNKLAQRVIWGGGGGGGYMSAPPHLWFSMYELWKLFCQDPANSFHGNQDLSENVLLVIFASK